MTITTESTAVAPLADALEAKPITAPARTLGIVALALGIASLVSGLNPILGIAAVAVGIVSLRTEPAARSFAVAGIVTGSVWLAGLVLGFGAFLTALPFLGVLGVLGN